MGPNSEYEKVRAENIARNERFLAKLGLYYPSTKEKLRPTERCEKKRKRLQNDTTNEKELRRSTRNTKNGNGVKVEGEMKEEKRRSKSTTHDFIVSDDCDDANEYQETRKKISAKGLRNAIEQSNNTHSAEISNQAIVHCIDRLYSMSEKALESRIKTISRAKGKNAREKLLVFHYALQEAGLEDLSRSV